MCENVVKLNCGDGCTPGECVFKRGQNTEFLPFKLKKCMIYELYIKKLVKSKSILIAA